PKLDDLAPSRVDGRKCVECSVEVDEIQHGFGGFESGIVNGYPFGCTAVLLTTSSTRVIDKHLPHEARRNADKVCAILPLHVPRSQQPKKRLVHERSRLQRMTVAFAPHVRASESAQFGFDERDQPVEGGLIAVAPRL